VAHPRLVTSTYQAMPWPGRLLADGRLADVTLKTGTSSFEQVLVIGTPGAPQTDTVLLPEYEESSYRHASADGRMQVQAHVPFAPSQVWLLDRQGFLWVGITGDYRIVRLTLAGDTVLALSPGWQPAPVTAAERDSAVAQLEWFRRQGGSVDPSRIPATRPAFNSLMVDDAGRLWVHRSRAAAPNGFWDVFDPGGRRAGTVEAPCDVRIAEARGERLYLVCSDPDGVPFIARYLIEGRP
jgi:hypothetical protein